MITLLQAEHEALLEIKAKYEALLAVINKPELIDFDKAVVLEAAHQVEKWGKSDREGKTPTDWYWLVGHLAGRALEHHKEAERLSKVFDMPKIVFERGINHHREKATHHTITAAAALRNWHAYSRGISELMRPGIATPKEAGND